MMVSDSRRSSMVAAVVVCDEKSGFEVVIVSVAPPEAALDAVSKGT